MNHILSVVDIHDFDVPTLFEIGNIIPSAWCSLYIYSFWLVGRASLVNIAAGDVKIDLMHPYRPQKTFNWPQRGDSCYVPVKNIIQKMSTSTASTR